MPSTDKISASISEFCALSGLGRTKVYELLGNGSIDSFYCGKRRLIILDSYHRFVERQRAAAPAHRAAIQAPPVSHRRSRPVPAGMSV